jgi:hypothetical protein
MLLHPLMITMAPVRLRAYCHHGLREKAKAHSWLMSCFWTMNNDQVCCFPPPGFLGTTAVAEAIPCELNQLLQRPHCHPPHQFSSQRTLQSFHLCKLTDMFHTEGSLSVGRAGLLSHLNRREGRTSFNSPRRQLLGAAYGFVKQTTSVSRMHLPEHDSKYSNIC